MALIKLSEAASRAGKNFTDFGEALKLLKKSRLPRKLKKKVKKLKKQQFAFGESNLMKFAEVYGKIGHLPCFDMTYEEAMKATTNDLPRLI